MPDAIDQSWSRIDPHKAVEAGIKLVCGYLSHDPSKNWTPAWVRAYHAVGIGVLLNWESDPGRPLLGAAAGHPDGADAVNLAQQLIRSVGYAPKNKISLVFSCDRDTAPTQYPAIDAYYRATKELTDMGGFLNGAYGEADLIEHLHAAALTAVEWQTLAWSGGRISTQADLYQSSINNTVANASVDIDKILHPATLGAWWAPGSYEESLDSSAVLIAQHPITPPEDGMFEIIHDTSEPIVGYYAWSLGCWRLIAGNTQFQMAKASGLAVNKGAVRVVTHAQRLRIQNLAIGH